MTVHQISSGCVLICEVSRHPHRHQQEVVGEEGETVGVDVLFQAVKLHA